jgi:putative nucleotidyltransferase with HDIG domain
MNNAGSIILHAAPNSDIEQEVFDFLGRHLTNTPREKLAAIIKEAPVSLGKNISEKTGHLIVSHLKKLGVTAKYNPGDVPLMQTPSGKDTLISSPNVSSQTETRVHHPHPLTNGSWKSSVSIKKPSIGKIAEVNKELWLIFSMLILLGVMNYLVTSHRLLLGLYALPTLFSAYYYGRRHATLTAFASVFLVGLLVHRNSTLFSEQTLSLFVDARWYDIIAWGGTLVITAYAMGTLCERSKTQMQELRSTYHGVLMILRQFISQDKYTENHCYRVSVYASKIAVNYCCNFQQIEDIRAAALLHDIGKLEISRDLLYKTAQFTKEEQEGMKRHVGLGADILEPVGGPFARIIPIILSHHDRYDGSGYHSIDGQDIPLEARIVSVADVYDALTSDRPYRKAMSPFKAKEILVQGSGKDFDPEVIKAFLKAFKKGEMEVPNLVI